MILELRLENGIMKISSTMKKFIKKCSKIAAISRKVSRKHGVSYFLQRKYK